VSVAATGSGEVTGSVKELKPALLVPEALVAVTLSVATDPPCKPVQVTEVTLPLPEHAPFQVYEVTLALSLQVH
jgi:hypothetical protein